MIVVFEVYRTFHTTCYFSRRAKKVLPVPVVKNEPKLNLERETREVQEDERPWLSVSVLQRERE